MSPSQLLMPLAFGAHAGSLLALTGSPVNVIVSEYADDAGVGRFGFFSFALVGLPLLAGSIAIVVLLGERLLPTRRPKSITRDLGNLAQTLVDAVRAHPRSRRAREQGLGRRRGRRPAAVRA